jgi:hypothetical protein
MGERGKEEKIKTFYCLQKSDGRREVTEFL